MHRLRHKRKIDPNKTFFEESNQRIANFKRLHETPERASQSSLGKIDEKTKLKDENELIDERTGSRKSKSTIIETLVKPFKFILLAGAFIGGTILVTIGAIELLFTDVERLKQH